MDTQNETSMASIEDICFLKQNRHVTGAKQLMKAIRIGAAVRIYLAMDADPAITEPIAESCVENEILCIWVPTMQALGHACGIEVGAAAAAVVQNPEF